MMLISTLVTAEIVKDVAYFRSHYDEAVKKSQECNLAINAKVNNNQIQEALEIQKSPECQAAKIATVTTSMDYSKLRQQMKKDDEESARRRAELQAEAERNKKAYQDLVDKYKGMSKSERQEVRRTCGQGERDACTAVIEAIRFHKEPIWGK